MQLQLSCLQLVDASNSVCLSLLMKLGPTDYWSRKASQFTGKPHRVIFDETLEKIYNRLYQQSVARKR